MIVRTTLTKAQKPTEEQMREIEEAENFPIVFDEDSPEMTPEMEKAFILAARTRNRIKAKAAG